MFSQPAWLSLLMALPLLALFLYWTDRRSRRGWERFVAPKLRSKLVRLSTGGNRWLTRSLVLSGLALITLALARPQWGQRNEQHAVAGRQVLIAIDISRSMQADDLPPSRLDFAKVSALDVLESIPEERVGLIAFATEAALLSPLTVDHDSVEESLLRLDSSLLPYHGTDFNRLLAEAGRCFRKSAAESKLLLIFSDGEAHQEIDPANVEVLQSQGVRCLTFGVGTLSGATLPSDSGSLFTDEEGRVVRSYYEPDILIQLSEQLGGSHRQVLAGESPVAEVMQLLQGIESEPGRSRFRSVPVERFHWFLLPGLLCLLFAAISDSVSPRTKRLKTLATCLGLFGLFCFSNNTALAGPPKSAIFEAFEKGINAANDSPDQAMEHFSSVLLSSNPQHQQLAHINLANLALRKTSSKIFNPSGSLSNSSHLLAEIQAAEAHLDAASQLTPPPPPQLDETRAYAQSLREALARRASSTNKTSRPPNPGKSSGENPNSDSESQKELQQGENTDPKTSMTDKPQSSTGSSPQPEPRQMDRKNENPASNENMSRLPGETPDQQARRILRANSDLKGPTRRRRSLLSIKPQKDW